MQAGDYVWVNWEGTYVGPAYITAVGTNIVTIKPQYHSAELALENHVKYDKRLTVFKTSIRSMKTDCPVCSELMFVRDDYICEQCRERNYAS